MLNVKNCLDLKAAFPDQERISCVVCPACKESLLQADLEFYQVCPFCGHKFELNADLEDFILEPVVRNWIRHQDGFPSVSPH